MMSQNVQSEGSTSPLPLLTSTNAKRTELSRGGHNSSVLIYFENDPEKRNANSM